MKPGVIQRVVAAESLHRITDQGAYSNIVMRRLSPDLDTSERIVVHHVVLDALRYLIRWDAAIEAVSNRSIDDIEPMVRAVLRILAQELIGDGHAAHGAVDSCVEATRELGHPRAKGFVNAVGRKLAIAEAPTRPGDGGFELGIPQWMFDRIASSRGRAEARAFFEAVNQPAAVGVRARPGAELPEGTLMVPGIPGAGYVSRPPRDAMVDLIDPASTAVALAVDAAPGMCVADLAAAPGGKTAALWDAMAGDGRLVAVDIHEGRMERTRERLEAMGVRPEFVVADARSTDLGAGAWDRVLIDAPCTGIGTMRRRPEIRHRLRPDSPGKLGILQAELIEAGMQLLKPGGRLVYSVCTLFPEETVELVEHHDARPPDLPGVVWGKGRLMGPNSTGTDGMFISVFDV